MTHLGDRVSALVDGQLPLEATDRAHVHLASCRGCREAVEAERLMKARLEFLSAPDPGSELVGRLLALGGPDGPLPPRPGHVPGSPRPVPVSLPLAAGPGRTSMLRSSHPPATRRAAGRPAGRPVGPQRVRLAGAVLGAVAVVGAGVGGLVLAAPEAPRGRGQQAPLDSIVVHRPLLTRGVVSADVSLQLRPAPSAAPAASTSSTWSGR